MKLTFRKTIMSALIGTTALVGAGSLANAGGFAVREQSAEGQGASFAGIAAGGSDLSSMFFNPATITLHKGIQAEVDAALILPYSKMKNGISLAPGPVPAGTFGSQNSGNIGELALVPSNYASFQVNDSLFVGFSANSPFGLVTRGDNTWAGSIHGVKSDLFMIQAGPTVGYKFNDMFSFGASVHAVYSKVSLTQNLDLAGVGTAELSGSDWGVNYSLGMLISPTETTRIGVGYNSGTKLKFDGDIEFTTIPALNDTITAKLNTPGTVTVGLRQQLGEKFTALLGFEWANWSNMKRLQANRKSNGATASYVEFDWNDSYFYSIGGEYKLNEMTTLRAGFAYEDSPIPDRTRGVRIPDADRYWLSIGASHQVNDNFRMSVAYTHIIVKDADVNLPFDGLPGIRGTFKQNINIISVSGTYKLDDLFASLFE